jgi:hypothetical protein
MADGDADAFEHGGVAPELNVAVSVASARSRIVFMGEGVASP